MPASAYTPFVSAHPFVEIMTLHRVGSGGDCERLQFYPTGTPAATDRIGSVIQL